MVLRDDIKAWVGSLPGWQQDLVRRLLTSTSLDDAGYKAALAIVLQAHGALGPDEVALAPEPPQDSDFPSTPSAGSAPRLVALGGLRGVGAVPETEELRFAQEGLTVIYGSNAAGKSSYVRALKRVCRTVDCDSSILADVFAAPADVPKKPTATLEWKDTSGLTSRRIDLTDPQQASLDAISVFDTRCAELYVDQRNTVAYVPPALRLLTRLAATQNRMRSDIEGQLRRLANRRPAFASVPSDTSAWTELDQLSAKSDIPTLKQRCGLSDRETERLAELRFAVASARTPAGRQDVEAAERDVREARSLVLQMRAIEALVGDDAAAALAGLARTARSTRAAAALATATFSGQPVPEVGNEAWRLMWEAARSFVSSGSTTQRFPPAEGQPCPLCLQPVGSSASEQLMAFEKQVTSDVQQQADEAQARLREAIRRLDGNVVARARTPFVAALRETSPALHAATEAFLAAAEARARLLAADALVGELPPLPPDSVEVLNRWAQKRSAHVGILQAAQDPEKEQQVRAELSELEARDALMRQLPQISDWVDHLRRITALNKAHSDLHTYRVTRRQNELSEAVVTGALREQLDRELDALRCGHIPVRVEGHGQVGATVLELSLVGASSSPALRAVLSEGEQRALSLSFFFAEVACADHGGGVVLDDPVSSLDDERREYIAARLVAEAALRQVVVFTHDLPFMLDIVEQASRASVPCAQSTVWRDQFPGRVDAHPPFKAMKFGPRVHALEERVRKWNEQPRAADVDEAWARVHSFYRDMRAAWERGVEERLFGGVVERFQREVKTRNLSHVRFDPKYIGQVEDGMTRCSRFTHDDATGAGGSLPQRTDLAKDVAALRQFEQDTKAKAKAN